MNTWSSTIPSVDPVLFVILSAMDDSVLYRWHVQSTEIITAIGTDLVGNVVGSHCSVVGGSTNTYTYSIHALAALVRVHRRTVTH
jgi:hypothetical protein